MRQVYSLHEPRRVSGRIDHPV